MNGAIYQADMWCEDCAEEIKQRIRAEGNAPEDEDDQHSYDSDEFPKDCDVSCESDTVEHCAAGEDCINAHEFANSLKCGVWLENDLTTDGIQYVKDAVREGGCVAALWEVYYDWIDFPVIMVCNDCGGDFESDELDEYNYCKECNDDAV